MANLDYCGRNAALSKEDISFIRSIAKSLINPNSPDFDDLVQEGSIAFMRALATYDSERASFRTYAARCIKNAMLDYLRKKIRHDRSEFTERVDCYSTQKPDDVLDLKMELEELKSKLTNTEKQVLDAILLCGSAKAASEHLKWHPKKLENAMARIRRKARKS